MKRCIKLAGIIALLVILGAVFTACDETGKENGYQVLTGTVSITGIAQVGQTLTANTSSLGGSGIITYQWIRGGSTAIGSDSTYVVQNGDLDSTITVTVTRSDNTGSITSAPTSAVISHLALTGTVSITGTAQVGRTLAANTSSLNGSGTITYQWKRNGSTTIGSGSTYTVQNGDIGSTITVTVTQSGNTGSVTSAPTSVVIDNTELTGSVSIFGTAREGYTLTASTYSLNGTGILSYIWKRDGNLVIGDNSSTYDVQNIDISSTITVTVSRVGYTGSITSSPTAKINSYSGLEYSLINDNTAYSVSKGTAIGAVVEIPAILNGLPVIEIGNFRNYTNMTSVTIPDSVTTIVYEAFRGCTGLINITIPNSVTEIRSGAFQECTSLTSITLPFVGTNRPDSDDIYIIPIGSSNSAYHFHMIFGAWHGNNPSAGYPYSLKTVILTGDYVIPRGAFSGGGSCYITNLSIPGNVKLEDVPHSVTDLTIGDNVIITYGSFYQVAQKLNRIMFGANVTIDSDVYGVLGSNNLKTAYDSGGAGTYISSYSNSFNSWYWSKL